MGHASARIRYPKSWTQPGPVSVEFNKKETAANTHWNFCHEAAHFIDLCIPVSPGLWKSYPAIAGYGKISTNIATALRAHEKFIVSLDPVTLTFVVGGRKLSIEEVIADPTIPDQQKRRLKIRHFERELKIHFYRSKAIELFAQAVACSVCEPTRIDAGAPGLRAIISEEAGRAGLVI